MSKINCYNVLLVEDEPLLLRSLQRHIEQLDLGFRIVAVAQNGKEALDLLSQQDVHLIISDILMPVMTGLELLAHVHKHLPGICVAILSGHADFDYAQNALRAGALDYILKPITPEKIENLLLKAKIKLSAQYELIEDKSLSGQSAQQVMEFAREYLKEHYSEPITLVSLAHQLGYSSAYLTKLFNKFESCTPIKYLTDLRITQAKQLLANTALPIKEVGICVGYDNQFYFSRIFRKQTGFTPSEYRAKSE